MTTKMITLASALALGASAFAATPQEIIKAGDWVAFSKLPYVQFTNNLAKADVDAVYNACLANTNYSYCANMAQLGYVDMTKTFNDIYTLDGGYNVLYVSLCARRALFVTTTNNEWRASILKQFSDTGDVLATKKNYENLWSVDVLLMFNFAVEHEAEAIEIADYALSKKDYRTASALLYAPYVKPEGGTGWQFVESDALKAWRMAHAEEIVAGLKELGDWNLYRASLFGLGHRDLAADDKDCSYVMKFFDASVWNDKNAPIWNNYYLTDWAFGRAQYEAFMKNSTDGMNIWRYGILKLPHNKRAEETKKWWTKIAKDPIAAREAAIVINDNDKLLDALLGSTENMTIAQINRAIAMAVALDADYRNDDVIKVLKNINNKYTLKLYDDRDTWEPILSKIRALIDVRN